APTRAMVLASNRIADLMEDMYFSKGAVIYRKGDIPVDIFFIVSGVVHLKGEEHENPWVMDARSIIGIIDANLERPRLRSAVAQSDVHALRFRAEDYLDMMEDNFEQQLGVLDGISTASISLMTDIPNGGFEEPNEEAYKSGRDM